MIQCKLGPNETIFLTITTLQEKGDPLVETWSVAPDPKNRFYRRYLEWVAAGNTPDPADPEPVLPPKIDIGADVPANQGDRMAEDATNLRAYLALGTPSGAQTVGALKLVIRILLWSLKRQGV